ncbi:Uncharacterised protein [Mycobacterium tuberculosis]|uniref:Uncharacterized protein n=1 Tax=Mycobacterium tuberculosis TaxID=1773 RepID=A0A0T9DSW4_MYCTX|nr:Uncharacterised protein [Mycobacterium tuberculosis]CFB95558.1 Uncharacterised protein [Mycobacterium tuberculosis]CFE48283.1 Uncharacterised protein [Mycobacterium tuberculosis]CFE79761.1 Uncharacterised protein [Mycobacterium tuberculosis]CFR42969.1 Uncharacterised protein [Mycobacterium tuberculosis]
MFHTANRSMEPAMSALMPHTVGSNPVGIWPPTTRDSLVFRGTRISVPALRMTCQSVESGTGRMTVCSGSNSTKARASASEDTTNAKSFSRNTDTSSGEAWSGSIAPSSTNSRMPTRCTTASW